MSHFDYQLSDMTNQRSFVQSMAQNQRGGRPQLRTSGSADGNPQLSVTTYDVSSIMQGAALGRPVGVVYDRYNQSTSSDLANLVNTSGGAETVLGAGRTSILPYDILSHQGFQDWRFTSSGGAAATEGAPNSGSTGPLPTGTASARDFVDFALRQAGDRYVFGAEADLNDADPSVFDCSELVQWAAHQVGITVPDGSQNQRSLCRQGAFAKTVDEAKHIKGALLFNSHHVAISLGTGNDTIEAMGSKYGVLQGHIEGRTFADAGLIPNLDYTR